MERSGPDHDAADVAQRALMGLIKTAYEPAILPLKEEMMRRFGVGVVPVESGSPLSPLPMSRRATALWKMGSAS